MNAPRPALGKPRPGPLTLPDPAARSWWLGPRGRAVLSVLIFVHLLAVIGEPLRMFSQGRQPGAPHAQLVRSGMAPYIDLAYLHHGYFFFAPNPGPSHLIDIKLTDADGSVRHLRLPNHRAQWPRLLYHRHFMLSEFLYQLYTPAPSELGPDVPISEPLLRDRALFERVRSSMEEHLAVRYGAEKAEIQLMEHRLPNAVEVFDRGLELNNEQFYLLLPDRPEPAPAASSSSERLPSGTIRETGPAGARGRKGSAKDSASAPGASPALPRSASPSQPIPSAPITSEPVPAVPKPEEVPL